MFDLQGSKVEEGEDNPDSDHNLQLLLQIQLILHIPDFPQQDDEGHGLGPVH